MQINHPEIWPCAAAPRIFYKYFPNIVPFDLHWLEFGAWEKSVWTRPANMMTPEVTGLPHPGSELMQHTMQLTCTCTSSLTRSRAMDTLSWHKSPLYHLCNDFYAYRNVLSCGISRNLVVHHTKLQGNKLHLQVLCFHWNFRPGRSFLITFGRKNALFIYCIDHISTSEKHQKLSGVCQ